MPAPVVIGSRIEGYMSIHGNREHRGVMPAPRRCRCRFPLNRCRLGAGAVFPCGADGT